LPVHYYLSQNVEHGVDVGEKDMLSSFLSTFQTVLNDLALPTALNICICSYFFS